MNKIQRPKFVLKFTTLLWVIVPTFIGFITNIIPAISEIKIWIFSLNVIIAIGITIFILIIYISKYLYELNKYCTMIENNNEGLKNDNLLIKEKNLKLEKEKNDIVSLNQAIIYHLQQGIINISDKESEYLKSLLNIINDLIRKDEINNE